MYNRDPPSRRDRMVHLALQIAAEDKSGYSQRPPSGRWGPDFDCSSLIYFLADEAGYDVGTGNDRVRFTGTMLKDFEKAGFQILPFANVGLGELEIGDILLNLALHAEIYVGDGKTVAATASEDGSFSGEAGDQTGHEIEVHPASTFTKEWNYVLRPPNEESGDEEMAVNYPPMNTSNGTYGMNQPWTGYGPNMYPQGMQPRPGGNLGQLNGYSSVNNNTYPSGPQGMGGQQLTYVKGIEGANNYPAAPNSVIALFDEDEAIMYIKATDQNGYPNLRVFKFTECTEEMPQHLSPLMQQPGVGATQTAAVESLTKEDIVAIIKEVMRDESAPPAPNQSIPRPPQSNGVQSRASGSRTN